MIERDVVAARVGDIHVFLIYSKGFNVSWATPLDILLGISAPPRRS